MRLHHLLGLVVLGLVGCKGDSGPYRVSGTVTFQGKSVPAGEIFFDPDVAAGNGGAQGYARVRDGRFDTAEGGRGIQGGAYVIRIGGYDGASATELPLGKPLFPEHRETRELPKQPSEQTFEVPAPPGG
jgi:hypothetical protein